MQELSHLVYCCCYKDLAMNLFRVKLCLFSREYNTTQFAYLPCASWSTAFPLNGFSKFVINSPCSHHLQGSLKHMYIPVFSKLFFILNSISVFLCIDVEFDKSRAYACSTNIKDKNRLQQLSGQFLE